MTTEQIDQVPAITKQHIDSLNAAKAALSNNQPHQKSPEGKIFSIVLEAISFVLHLLHAGHTSDGAPDAATTTENHTQTNG